MTKTERNKSAAALRSLLKSAVTIARLAELLDVDYKAVWKWQVGYVDIPCTHAYVISRAFDMQLERLRPDLEKKIKKVKKKLDK